MDTAEAFVSEPLLQAGGYLVGRELVVGERVGAGSMLIPIADSPVLTGAYPGSPWRVQALRTSGHATGSPRWAAEAIVPLERLDPWEALGRRGRVVERVIQAIDGASLDAIIAFERVAARAPRPYPLFARTFVEAAIRSAVTGQAQRIDRGSFDQPDANSWIWRSAAWDRFEQFAVAVALDVALSEDDALSENRATDLLERLRRVDATKESAR